MVGGRARRRGWLCGAAGGAPEREGVTFGYMLFAMAATGVQPDDGTDEAAAYVADVQGGDGGWYSISRRPPLEDSNVVRPFR
jgi:hypothetical protein